MSGSVRPAQFLRATAVCRPLRGDIALMVMRGRSIRSEALPIDAARELHEALGVALRLAACRDRPLAAVPGCTEGVPVARPPKPTGAS